MATSKITKVVREDNSGVDFNSADGRSVSVETAELSEDMITNLVVHGILQKVGDSYAGAKTVEEAFEKCSALVERLLAGDWKTVRASGGKRRQTILLRALVRASGEDEDSCATVLDGMDDDDKKGLKDNPAIAAAIAAIQAEDAAAKAASLQEKAAEAGDFSL